MSEALDTKAHNTYLLRAVFDRLFITEQEGGTKKSIGGPSRRSL